MKELTDEELLELASVRSEQDDDSMDVGYYQESHRIVDGNYKVYAPHLYYHYKKWSISPIGLEVFYAILKLDRKIHKYIFINKELCTINLELNLGSYVRSKKSKEKKERLGQIPCIKSKTKCED
jgi:hypothetical protein